MLKRPLCLASLLYAAALFILLRLFPVPVYDNPLIDGRPVLVTGKVEKKQVRNDKSVIYLSHVSVGPIPQSDSDIQSSSDIQFNSYRDPLQGSAAFDMTPESSKRQSKLGAVVYLQYGEPPPIGAEARFGGEAVLFETPGNPGQFDQAGYYQIQGIDFMLQKARTLSSGRRFSALREGMYRFQSHMSDTYDRLFDKKDAGVIKAMLLGDKAGLDTELKELYQRSGIAHILAISGLHISLIGMGLYRLLRKAGLGFLPAGAAGGTVMTLFCLMTGGGTSTVRAVIMYLTAVAASWLGRSYDMLTAMSFSALLLLWEQPLYLRHSGFLLSFGAVAGIGVFYPVLESLYPCRVRILKGPWTAFLSGASVTLMTLPVTLFYFYQLPLLASFMNLAVIPLMGILLAASMLSGGAGALWLPAGKLAAFPCRMILSLYERLCALCDGLPLSLWVPGRPAAAGIFVYYAVLFAGMAVCRRLTEAVARRKAGRAAGKALLPVLLLFLVLLLGLHRTSPLEITMLDAGQGDAACLRAGRGFNCLIDGGSSDVFQIGKYRIQPYLKSRGVKRIQYAFVSHTDQDHISGLKELLAGQGSGGCLVENLVLPDIGNRDDAFAELESLARENGTEVLYMSRGDQIRRGRLSIGCLYPEAGLLASDKNDASMVLEVSLGDFRGLFMGDLGTTGERRILEQGICRGHTSHTFLKTGHHGSDTSTGEEFLDQMKFRLAFISCGRDNRYGHPDQKVLDRLRERGVDTYITFQGGALTVKTDGKRAWTESFREEKYD